MGASALHLAAEAGHVDVVRYLIKHGAQVDACEEFGEHIYIYLFFAFPAERHITLET